MKYWSIIGVCWVITILWGIIVMSQNTPDSFQMQEWDNQPIEQRLAHLEQLIEIQSIKNEEAQKVLDKTVNNWVIYRAIRDDMLDSAGLQVKTVALEKPFSFFPKAQASDLDYLTEMWFTSEQRKMILDHTVNVRDPDHFIMWLWWIFKQENGGSFVDWETNFLAWRLKKGMKYKDFKTQLDWRVATYNKFRYKNNTMNDRLQKSRYCVGDYAGNHDGCPNWQRNVGSFIKQYNPTQEIKIVKVYFYKAVIKQKEADVLWKLCIDNWECNQ